MGQLLPLPLIAVGAAFDFHAGTLRQAPPSWQRVGLEWLFRLGCEPRRLWRRYVFLNPRYVQLVMMQALRLRTFRTVHDAQPPQFIAMAEGRTVAYGRFSAIRRRMSWSPSHTGVGRC